MAGVDGGDAVCAQAVGFYEATLSVHWWLKSMWVMLSVRWWLELMGAMMSVCWWLDFVS